jgi:MraZ protein
MAFGGVFYLELDQQGRALLPAPLRLYAGITDEVVVVGANEYLELWNTQRWDQEMVVVEESAWHIAETSEEQR